MKFGAGVLVAGLAMSLSLGINLSPPTGQVLVATEVGYLPRHP